MVPKMSQYLKRFHETKHMLFFIKDDEIIKIWNNKIQYNKIWNKVSSSIRKEI